MANLASLFPGLEVVAAYPFRIIRDADVEIQEIEADDLLETMQQSIRKRKFASVVKVEIYESMPDHIRDLLIENLEMTPNDVYVMSAPLGLSSLWQVYNNVERHELKFPVYHPVVPKIFRDATLAGDIFEVIKRQNILLHQPYDSFIPVIDFLRAAARDPNVLAIKQTLYRVGQNAPVVEALLEAASAGNRWLSWWNSKRASMKRAISAGRACWSRKASMSCMDWWDSRFTAKSPWSCARKEMAFVVISILVREITMPLPRSSMKTLGSSPVMKSMASDITDLFNHLTGYSTKHDFRKLLVAPFNLRTGLEKLIRREIEHARAGNKAHLIFKVNAIVDQRFIELLYEASRAGVKVDLLVRSMCCLKPGIRESATTSM